MVWYKVLCRGAVLCLVTQSCLTLCDPVDYGLPGFSVHRDSPGKNTGVVAMPSSTGPSQPREQTQVSRITGGFFTVLSHRAEGISGA